MTNGPDNYTKEEEERGMEIIHDPIFVKQKKEIKELKRAVRLAYGALNYRFGNSDTSLLARKVSTWDQYTKLGFDFMQSEIVKRIMQDEP